MHRLTKVVRSFVSLFIIRSQWIYFLFEKKICSNISLSVENFFHTASKLFVLRSPGVQHCNNHISATCNIKWSRILFAIVYEKRSSCKSVVHSLVFEFFKRSLLSSWEICFRALILVMS